MDTKTTTTLFEVPEVKPDTSIRCKHCKHSERTQCRSKIFYYCGLLKSNRTNNGKLLIKANKIACKLFDNVKIKQL